MDGKVHGAPEKPPRVLIHSRQEGPREILGVAEGARMIGWIELNPKAKKVEPAD